MILATSVDERFILFYLWFYYLSLDHFAKRDFRSATGDGDFESGVVIFGAFKRSETLA
jgi:hypothetical protein